jgi:hypothetical protein
MKRLPPITRRDPVLLTRVRQFSAFNFQLSIGCGNTPRRAFLDFLVALAAMCIGLVVTCGCVSMKDRMDAAVGMYPNAPDIGAGKLVPGPGVRSLMNEWQIKVMSPDGKYALVDSSGSRVKVLHALDKSLHVFYSYVDDCYPSELRQSQDHRFLYLEIERARGGSNPKALFVLVYDMERRCVIGRAGVDFRPR